LREESNLLAKKELEVLLEIPVIKRPFKPIHKSKTRAKKFGNQYWYISAYPIKERTYNSIRDKVEKTRHSISQKENIKEDEISFLRWPTKTEFCKTAKEGDQLIINLNNESKTRSYIYPPSTILKKDVDGRFTLFYHDDRNSEGEISWTKFQAAIKNLKLEKEITKRTKIISSSDIEKIKLLWK
jgi:hypothetical protein